MTTAYTSLLGLALPVTGELSGTWGDTVNNSITSLLDTSVAGTTNVSTDTDVTLTTTTGAANTARQAILLFSGARTALRTVTAPAQSKIYTVINATTGGFSVKLVGVGPTTGVTIVAGESAVCAWNGSDFIKISNTGGSASFTNVTVTGTTTLSGLTASTALALDASKNVVSVTNTGTGNNVLSASPTLTGTIGAASLTLSTDLTLSGGTANGVAYLNGSKVVTSGSALTFDGTALGVSGTANNAVSVTSTATTTALKLDNTNANGWGSNLAIFTGGSAAGYFGTIGSLLGSTAQDLAIYATSSKGVRIYTNDNNERMRVTSAGDVGIGTSSPAAKLDVYQATAGSTAAKFVHVNGNAIYINPSYNYYDAYNHIFRSLSGTTTYATIDNSGNLGLGVTPSAWNSAGMKAFQIGGVALTQDDTIFRGRFFTNTGFASGNFVYLQNNHALQYLQRGDTGEHSWYTAASGTAGNAITFTQAMTLNASAELNIDSGTGGGRLTFQPGATQNQILSTTTSFGAYNILRYVATQHQWLNASSTQAMTLDASGNLGVGTTSPASALHIVGDTSLAGLLYLGASTVFQEQRLSVIGTTSGSTGLAFSQWTGAAFTERARIDSSGNFLCGATSGASDRGTFASPQASMNTLGLVSTDDASNGGFILFRNSAFTAIGSVSRVTTTNAVVYNTTSDYRLKTVTGTVTGQGARIDALKPIDYQWTEGGQQARGFLAHEFQTVYPNSVTGDKDAVDANGNPVYQAMQASTAEVIADLVAEIKSLRQRVATLEAK
jgi:hypothetical protein